MSTVEKAFTHRLYCPRKLVVKRAVGRVFLAACAAQRYIA